MVSCDSNTPHSFCLRCMNKYIKSLLSNMSTDIKCMHIGTCTGHFSKLAVTRCTTTKQEIQLQKLEQRSMLRKLFPNGFVSCPFCNTEFLDEREYKVEALVCINRKCRKVSCCKCNGEYHFGSECPTDSARVIKEEKETYSIIRACPGCNVDIYRTEGCNHMKCLCGTMMCYACGKDITTTMSSHPCPIFGDIVRRDPIPEPVVVRKRQVDMSRHRPSAASMEMSMAMKYWSPPVSNVNRHQPRNPTLYSDVVEYPSLGYPSLGYMYVYPGDTETNYQLLPATYSIGSVREYMDRGAYN